MFNGSLLHFKMFLSYYALKRIKQKLMRLNMSYDLKKEKHESQQQTCTL